MNVPATLGVNVPIPNTVNRPVRNAIPQDSVPDIPPEGYPTEYDFNFPPQTLSTLRSSSCLSMQEVLETDVNVLDFENASV